MSMVEAAIQAGRVLKVVFNQRHRGDVQVLKRHLDSGQAGSVYCAKGYWLRRDGIPARSWFTNREMPGGGPLIDIGVHVLDLALYLMGEPRVLSASASTFAEHGRRAHRPVPTRPASVLRSRTSKTSRKPSFGSKAVGSCCLKPAGRPTTGRGTSSGS